MAANSNDKEVFAAQEHAEAAAPTKTIQGAAEHGFAATDQ
jgi:hypothetical protein